MPFGQLFYSSDSKKNFKLYIKKGLYYKPPRSSCSNRPKKSIESLPKIRSPTWTHTKMSRQIANLDLRIYHHLIMASPFPIPSTYIYLHENHKTQPFMYGSCGFWDGESIIRSSQLFLNFCIKIWLPTISSPYDRLCWKPSWWDFHRSICLIILNSYNLTCHNCNWKNEKGSYHPALFGGNTPPQKHLQQKKNLKTGVWKGMFIRSFFPLGL